MITIEGRGRIIYVFSRDENNKLVVTKDEDFYPYFYYEDKNGEFKTIDNKKATKVWCDTPYEVVEKREQHEKTYESDCRYTNRYIINMYDNIPKNDIRICYIDIEVGKTEKGWEAPELANNPVKAICCYDSFTKEYKQFCLTVTHDNELSMLHDFCNYILKIDPDLMTGWNSDNFDFPLLFKRIKRLSNNTLDIGRKIKGFKGMMEVDEGFNNKVSVGGRILFDMMYAYKKMNPGGRESWALDYISKYEKIGQKMEYKGELDDLFKNDVQKYMEYNKQDVQLLVLLNEKLHIIDFFDEMRRLCFCKFEDVFMNSKIADCLCLKYARDHNFILPRAEKHEQQGKYEGGFVHKSIPGLHKNVACCDYKSLYPSIMMAFNMSYETILEKKEDGCTNVFDKYYFKNEDGIIPAVVKKLLDKRAESKREMKKHDRNSIEYKSLNTQQLAQKITANALYGVLAFKNFRLYRREIASAITFAARTMIHLTKDWFEEKGYETIYQDTDSCFILLGNTLIEDMQILVNEFNKYLHNYLKQFGVIPERDITELEFEKVYSTIFFKGKVGSNVGVKKRYAGLKIWEGDFLKKYIVDVVGFESKRSDSPTVGREFMKTILSMIVHEKPKEEIDEYIEDFKIKIINDFKPEDIAFPIGITKELESYANQIHARASRMANEYHNAQISRGDKIKYIFIKHPNKVIAFHSDKFMPDGYELDYDKIINRIVHLKVGPIYESLNWVYNYPQKKNKKIKKPEDMYKQIELW